MPATEVLDAIEPYEKLHESDYLIPNSLVITRQEEEYPHISQQEAEQVKQYINDLEPDCS